MVWPLVFRVVVVMRAWSGRCGKDLEELDLAGGGAGRERGLGVGREGDGLSVGGARGVTEKARTVVAGRTVWSMEVVDGETLAEPEKVAWKVYEAAGRVLVVKLAWPVASTGMVARVWVWVAKVMVPVGAVLPEVVTWAVRVMGWKASDEAGVAFRTVEVGEDDVGGGVLVGAEVDDGVGWSVAFWRRGVRSRSCAGRGEMPSAPASTAGDCRGRW